MHVQVDYIESIMMYKLIIIFCQWTNYNFPNVNIYILNCIITGKSW